MAIDSVKKRLSILALSRFWRGAGVVPNSTIDQEDRQSIGRIYSGILVDEIEEVEDTSRSCGQMGNSLINDIIIGPDCNLIDVDD